MQNKRNVKKEILSLLLSGEKSTRELAMELDYVDKKGIPQYKNIEKQLKSLQKNGVISCKKRRGSVGAPKTYWSIRHSVNALKYIVNEFMRADTHLIEQHYTIMSKEVQKMINKKLIDSLAADWWIGYTKAVMKEAIASWGDSDSLRPADDITFPLPSPHPLSPEPEKRIKAFYDRLGTIDKDSLLEMARTSPAVLRILLFPEAYLLELHKGAPDQDNFILSEFIYDCIRAPNIMRNIKLKVEVKGQLLTTAMPIAFSFKNYD